VELEIEVASAYRLSYDSGGVCPPWPSSHPAQGLQARHCSRDSSPHPGPPGPRAKVEGQGAGPAMPEAGPRAGEAPSLRPGPA
jgi:hypothetical protein